MLVCSCVCAYVDTHLARFHAHMHTCCDEEAHLCCMVILFDILSDSCFLKLLSFGLFYKLSFDAFWAEADFNDHKALKRPHGSGAVSQIQLQYL